MTTNRRAGTQISSRNGKLRVRNAWLDVDGLLAVVVIAIILTVRVITAVAAVIFPRLARLAARFARGSADRIVLVYRALRAFYIP